MNRTQVCIGVFLLAGGTLACGSRSPDPPDVAVSEPDVIWPVPTGWKEETFALPPGFAPTLPYQGTEELRFMPGFFTPTAPDFWSYEFVWWLDQPPAFDAASVGESLTAYFRGLATTVGGDKYPMDTAGIAPT